MGIFMIVVILSNVQVTLSGTVPGVGLNDTLTIGYLLSWSHEWAVGPYIGSSILIAIREIGRRQLLPGYTIDWVLEDTWCQSTQGIKAAVRAWSRTEDLDVLLGGGCSIVCQPVSLLAAAWGLPVVSYGCASDVLSDKHTHPTFSRSVGLYIHVAQIFLNLAEEFDWNHVGIISDSVDLFVRMAQEMQKLFKAAGKTSVLYTSHTTITDSVNSSYLEKLRQILRVLKTNCRVIFVLMYSLDVRNTLVLAHEEDMLTGYVYIGTESELPLDINKNFRPDLGLELYEGVIDVEIAQNAGPTWDAFRQDVVDSFQDPVFDGWPHLRRNDSYELVNSFAGTVHDAILMWAYGVNKTLEQGYAPDDGFKVTKNIFNLTFEGITGSVTIDERGDRKSNYAINILQKGKAVTILDYLANIGRMVKRYKPDSANDWEGLIWSGNQTTVPRDAPICGWSNELCETGGNVKAHIIVIVVFIVGASFLLLSVALFRKHRYAKKLHEATSYLVNWAEVEEVHDHLTESNLTLSSADPSSTEPRQHRFCHVVRFKSEYAAARPMGDKITDITDRRVLEELRDMTQLNHDNVNGFLGISLEAPHMYILMSYASRGSLLDVLADNDVTLTWDFQVSLITDIAKGMKFIHASSPGWHGHLTSSNCVIDSRWICKITDYGLHHIRQNAPPSESNINSLLWTAPEILRNLVHFQWGTKKGDVYSFGIICQEIIYQTLPYGDNTGADFSADVIVSNVKRGLIPPFRPVTSTGTCGLEWLQLMDSCWQESPEKRPGFSEILSTIRRIHGGEEFNLVDSMISRLEVHSNKLEILVSQRSQELFDEKEKVEFLLSELLPKSIAEKLKLNQIITPESFENVTIFFSDVVSFTRISAAGSPIDVVHMLNLMYTLFDDIATRYDVYKVATIGDAYFVASGVPIRNGNKHAREVCAFALELVKAIASLPIPHLPNENLRLRVGIHSGPCLAGVTGIKMPRYLLFGDSIDLAARLESSGESMRIQVSQTTADLLPQGSFELEHRSDKVVMVGHGELTTYWLNSLIL